MPITLDKYHVGLVVPDAKLDGRLDAFWPIITTYAADNGVDTDAKMIAFVASCLNETGLRAVEEASYINTSYDRIKYIFGPSAPVIRDVEEWRKLGKKGFDEKFFNHVYDDSNRPNGYKLGNPPGTGYKYRGRGINQLTGYPNYRQAQKETGLPLVENPDLLLTPEGSVRAALRYWSKNDLNAIVADGTERSFLAGMKAMNSGLQDFSQHLHYWHALNEAIKKPVPRPAPATPVEAAKQAASGKTGISNVIAGAASAITIGEVVAKTGEIQGAVNASKGLFASLGVPSPYAEITLGSIILLCIGFNLARYAVKLWNGDAVSR